MNYGEGVAVPKMAAQNMPTRDWSKILPVVHNLSMSGVLTADDVTESFVRKVLRMPQRDPETARAGFQAEPEPMEAEEELEE